MAAPKINSAIGGKELIEKVNQIIDNTQDKLPNASTSGKVLKSTNTTGGVEWGDVEIDTTWGNITGTLSNQTDLNTVLNNKATTTSSNFVASEKVYNQGSTAAITLTNGRIFYCTGSSITLPSVVDGVCITCIVTASSVSWGGNIRWKGNKAPTLTSNYDLVSFVGYSGYWYGA